MIRFVDLTGAYWPEPFDPSPCCGFIDTVTDRFVENDIGVHVFDSIAEVEPLGPRFVGLVPDGFFTARPEAG